MWFQGGGKRVSVAKQVVLELIRARVVAAQLECVVRTTHFGACVQLLCTFCLNMQAGKCKIEMFWYIRQTYTR